MQGVNPNSDHPFPFAKQQPKKTLFMKFIEDQTTPTKEEGKTAQRMNQTNNTNVFRNTEQNTPVKDQIVGLSLNPPPRKRKRTESSPSQEVVGGTLNANPPMVPNDMFLLACLPNLGANVVSNPQFLALMQGQWIERQHLQRKHALEQYQLLNSLGYQIGDGFVQNNLQELQNIPNPQQPSLPILQDMNSSYTPQKPVLKKKQNDTPAKCENPPNLNSNANNSPTENRNASNEQGMPANGFDDVDKKKTNSSGNSEIHANKTQNHSQKKKDPEQSFQFLHYLSVLGERLGLEFKGLQTELSRLENRLKNIENTEVSG